MVRPRLAQAAVAYALIGGGIRVRFAVGSEAHLLSMLLPPAAALALRSLTRRLQPVSIPRRLALLANYVLLLLTPNIMARLTAAALQFSLAQPFVA
jgi:hypothetical protein